MRSALFTLVAMSAWPGSTVAMAQTSPLRIELLPPATLSVGDRAEIAARIDGAGPHPVLITPTAEGTALEVVRGRLTRADATVEDDGTLIVRIPVVARTSGTSVLRVHVRAFACERECVGVETQTTVAVAIRAARQGAHTVQAFTPRLPYGHGYDTTGDEPSQPVREPAPR